MIFHGASGQCHNITLKQVTIVFFHMVSNSSFNNHFVTRSCITYDPPSAKPYNYLKLRSYETANKNRRKENKAREIQFLFSHHICSTNLYSALSVNISCSTSHDQSSRPGTTINAGTGKGARKLSQIQKQGKNLDCDILIKHMAIPHQLRHLPFSIIDFITAILQLRWLFCDTYYIYFYVLF